MDQRKGWLPQGRGVCDSRWALLQPAPGLLKRLRWE
jgi:hypothetical protein